MHQLIAEVNNIYLQQLYGMGHFSDLENLCGTTGVSIFFFTLEKWQMTYTVYYMTS